MSTIPLGFLGSSTKNLALALSVELAKTIAAIEAADIAKMLGVSRATAYRYLSDDAVA